MQSHLYSLSICAEKVIGPSVMRKHPEIFSYIQDLVTDYNLRAFCRLNTEVLAAHYQVRALSMAITATGSKYPLKPSLLIFASGPLHIPQIPHLPGIEKFRRQSFSILRNGIILMI